MTIQWPHQLLSSAKSDGAQVFEFVIVAYITPDGALAINSARRCECEVCQQIFLRAVASIQFAEESIPPNTQPS